MDYEVPSSPLLVVAVVVFLFACVSLSICWVAGLGIFGLGASSSSGGASGKGIRIRIAQQPLPDLDQHSDSARPDLDLKQHSSYNSKSNSK